MKPIAFGLDNEKIVTVNIIGGEDMTLKVGTVSPLTSTWRCDTLLKE